MTTAAFENQAYSLKTQSISVNGSEKACINCQYFEQYFRRNRGNVRGWMGTSKGYCILKEEERCAMAQPCIDFLPYE